MSNGLFQRSILATSHEDFSFSSPTGKISFVQIDQST